QSVQAHAVPTAVPYLPGKNGLLALQIDFRVGEARPRINVRAARLDVVAMDCGPRRYNRENGRQKKPSNSCREKFPHDHAPPLNSHQLRLVYCNLAIRIISTSRIEAVQARDRKSTRLNSSHRTISY